MKELLQKYGLMSIEYLGIQIIKKFKKKYQIKFLKWLITPSSVEIFP